MTVRTQAPNSLPFLHSENLLGSVFKYDITHLTGKNTFSLQLTTRALPRIFQWGEHQAMWGPLAQRGPLQSQLILLFFIYSLNICRLNTYFKWSFFNICDAKYINTYNISGAVILNCGGAKNFKWREEMVPTGARRKNFQMWNWNCENIGLIEFFMF